MELDGIDDYIDCGGASNLNIDNVITISAWINMGRIDDWNILVGRIDGANGYELRFRNGVLNLAIGDGTTHIYPLSTTVLNTNNWTYIVAAYSDNDDSVFYYINGNKETLPITASLKKCSSSSSLKIGDRPVWSHPFIGLTDDIRIYDTVLSSSQIKQNYIAGLNSLLSKGLISADEYNERIESLSQK